MIRISVYSQGNAAFEVNESGDKEITIGRSPGCIVRLDEPNVSRLHAAIFKQSGQWIVEKKSSFGQLQVNGQEVENAFLHGGEEVAIASFVLRINLDDANASAESDSGVAESEPSEAINYDQGGSEAAHTGEYEFSENNDDNATKVLRAPAVAILRFEPGVANTTTYVIEKDVTLIGRGTQCDVVLLEKKASRKHLEIRREGLSFYLRDLNSGNGTFLNGEKILEAELVAGDILQVGESKFQFTVENQKYFQEKSPQAEGALLPIANENEGSQQEFFAPAVSKQMSEDGFTDQIHYDAQGNPVEGTEEDAADPNDKSLINKWRRKFRKLDKRQQTLITVAVVLVMLMVAFSPEEKTGPSPAELRKACIKNPKFSCLSQAKKKAIKTYYEDLLQANEKKDYDRMLILANQIDEILQGYLETNQLRQRAKLGQERIKRAEREKEELERRKRLQAEIQRLEKMGQAIFEKAVKDKSERPRLESHIQEIFAQDPTNLRATGWRDSIKRLEEEERQAEIARKKKEALKARAEAAFERVERIWKDDGNHLFAIEKAKELPAIGYRENNYLQQVDKLIEDINADLRAKVDPIVKKADEFRKAGDLVAARDEYIKALAIEKNNGKALNGLSAIRETLFLTSKQQYIEGILAEDISNISQAKRKFEECVRTAPETVIGTTDYKKRCQNKLKKYEGFP